MNQNSGDILTLSGEIANNSTLLSGSLLSINSRLDILSGSLDTLSTTDSHSIMRKGHD